MPIEEHGFIEKLSEGRSARRSEVPNIPVASVRPRNDRSSRNRESDDYPNWENFIISIPSGDD
jgi:hypothetical protein